MRRRRAVRPILRTAVIWLLTVLLSPLIVVAGEAVRRHVLARPTARAAWPGRRQVRRRSAPGTRVAHFAPGRAVYAQESWRRRRFLMLWVTNPLWIALTAPARWMLGRAASLRPRRPGQPPDAGVREPRRPRPGTPGGSVALAEPRTRPVIARLLGTVSREQRDDRQDPGLRGRRLRPVGRWRHKPAH